MIGLVRRQLGRPFSFGAHIRNKITKEQLNAQLQHEPDLGGSVVVSKSEAMRLASCCMQAVGVEPDQADRLADVLVNSDYRSHYSHGLNRLHMYVNDVRQGVTECSGCPKVLSETSSTGWVDGCNLLGPVVGHFSMQLAIDKAKATGVGWVAAKGSNHYSFTAYYPLMAVRQGLIGVSFTNTSPLVVPTRAKKATLGTNPLCVAAPALNGDSFVLDMATSSAAIGKCEIKQRWHKPIPTGWGVDSDGWQLAFGKNQTH